MARASKRPNDRLYKQRYKCLFVIVSSSLSELFLFVSSYKYVLKPELKNRQLGIHYIRYLLLAWWREKPNYCAKIAHHNPLAETNQLEFHNFEKSLFYDSSNSIFDRKNEHILPGSFSNCIYKKYVIQYPNAWHIIFHHIVMQHVQCPMNWTMIVNFIPFSIYFIQFQLPMSCSA